MAPKSACLKTLIMSHNNDHFPTNFDELNTLMESFYKTDSEASELGLPTPLLKKTQGDKMKLDINLNWGGRTFRPSTKTKEKLDRADAIHHLSTKIFDVCPSFHLPSTLPLPATLATPGHFRPP